MNNRVAALRLLEQVFIIQNVALGVLNPRHIKSWGEIDNTNIPSLLDEPFSNISPLYLDNIKNLITTEKAHKIIIITDHYYRDVIDISDALYLLNNGCTRKTDKLEDLEDYNYLNPGKLKSGTR